MQENTYQEDGNTVTAEVNPGGGEIAGKIKNQILFFKDFMYLFLDRGKGRGKEKERDRDVRKKH